MNNKRQTGEGGFSLIELLISATIFAIVTAAIFSLLNSSLQIGNISNQNAEAQQNLRIAQEYITRDLYNTADGLRGFNPMIKKSFVFNYLSRSPITFSDPDFTPIGMVTADNETNNIPVLSADPGTTVLSQTDRITLLVAPDPGSSFADIEAEGVQSGNKKIFRNANQSEMFVANNDAARVSPGNVFLLINNNSSGTNYGTVFVAVTAITDRPGAAGKILSFGSTGSYGLNADVFSKMAIDNTVPLRLRRIWLVHYFVDNEKRLVRRIFGQPSVAQSLFTDNIIAEHVTQLEFRHFLRRVQRDLDGKIISISQPEALDQFTNEDDQNAERQVEVRIGTETVREVTNNPALIEGRRVEASTLTVTSPRNLQFYNSLEPSAQ